MCNVTPIYDLKIRTTEFNPFVKYFSVSYRCTNVIIIFGYVQIEFLLDTSERESFQKLKIGNNVTLLEIVRLRNSEIVPALNK